MLDSYLIPISERQKHLTYEHHIFRPFFVSNSISASCSGFLSSADRRPQTRADPVSPPNICWTRPQKGSSAGILTP